MQILKKFKRDLKKLIVENLHKFSRNFKKKLLEKL